MTPRKTMQAVHKLMIHARCPIENRVDYYEVTVECDRMIKVEDIETAVANHRGSTDSQESLCQALYSEISSARWTLTGRHGKHTDTTVTCG